MSQSSGTVPQPADTERMLLLKWLQALIKGLG